MENKQIKKALLINPPFYYFPGVVAKAANYLRIPLGLCYLSSYIREKNNITVEIIDAPARGWNLKEVEREIIDFCPDLIGISVVTANVNIARQIIALAKKNNKDLIAVVGGPHVSARPEDLADVADICVIGEGERTLSELIECLKDKRPFLDIKGTAVRHNGVVRINPRREFIADLDSLPAPALDLIDITKYRHIYPYRQDKKVASILTSRGCPYDCYFCGNRQLWDGSVRYRSIDNVIEEIKQIKENLGVLLFWIEDDLFGPEPRVKEFCQKLIKQNLQIGWICHMRCDSVGEDTLLLMKKAGCLEIQVGVESGNDNILKEINKKLTIRQIKAFFKIVKKSGINTWATFIIGLYEEDKETIKETINLSKELDPTYVTFIQLLPFPGTRIYKDYSDKGYLKRYDWSRYSWHNGIPVFETDFLSSQDLIRLKKRAYLEFYLRPQKILSYILQLLKTGSVRAMLRNFLLFIKLALNI